MNFFEDIQNMGNILSEDEKLNLKQMGEKFYGNIDMEKYKPTPKEELKNDFIHDENTLERIKYVQLQKAVQSGLSIEDFTDEELQIWDKLSGLGL